MHIGHHPHHGHSHDDDPSHGTSPPGVPEEPLDVASQSLADALRASFGILKIIMGVLFVLYLFSNVRRIESHEQALILRLGQLQPGVKEAGLVWAFPFPIDEIIPLPTRRSNELRVDSHTFHRQDDEKDKPLNFITRGSTQGLKPGLDGALMTADAGLVHTRWRITYSINDVSAYVAHIAGRQVEAAERLITTLLENAAIQVAAEMTAEEVIRTKLDVMQGEVLLRLNRQLKALNSGIDVSRAEMYEPTPPIQIRQAFDNTQKTESAKLSRIRSAEQQRTKMLNETAGAAYPRVLAILDAIDAATAKGAPVEDLRRDLDTLLTEEVEGEAGRAIKGAGAYLSKAVGQMQSDVELYRTLLPEFERNPSLLIARLWERTKEQILNQPGVSKVYRPAGTQFRLHIPLDPEEARIEEERRLQRKEFDPKQLVPEKWVPVGPEYE